MGSPKEMIHREHEGREGPNRTQNMNQIPLRPQRTGASPVTPNSAAPVLALSIRQPWAWMILHAGKDIENRTWPTRFRGRIFIHASKGCTRIEYEDALWFAGDLPNGMAGSVPRFPELKDLPRGGIVGEVEIVDCVRKSDSNWFVGEYGFVLRNAKPLPFRPCKGALNFFKPGL